MPLIAMNREMGSLGDRKSTRLNSSHSSISYAVFCLKKKNWEIIDDNLKQRGWSLGCVSAVDRDGRTIWIADAHRDDGKRCVVRADEKVCFFQRHGAHGHLHSFPTRRSSD